jgi:hypothetical protein
VCVRAFITLEPVVRVTESNRQRCNSSMPAVNVLRLLRVFKMVRLFRQFTSLRILITGKLCGDCACQIFRAASLLTSQIFLTASSLRILITCKLCGDCACILLLRLLVCVRCGCVGVWVCGCVGVWVCACVSGVCVSVYGGGMKVYACLCMGGGKKV